MKSNPSQKQDLIKILQDEITVLRKQILKERELMDYSFLLQKIIDNSPYPMWIADHTGLMQKANNALLKTLNLKESDLIGKYNVLNDQNLIKNKLLHHVEKVFKELVSSTFIMTWSGTESKIENIEHGRDVWIEASIFPILNQRGELSNIICQWFDITKQKNAEIALEKQKEYLEAAVKVRTIELEQKNAALEKTSEHLNEIQSQMMQNDKMASLGFLTASIAHDLNNPLNYIQGAYHYLNDKISRQKPIPAEEGKEIMEALEKGITQSISIVKSLNQFSRSNIDQTEIFDIHEVLNNCLVILQNKLKYHIEIVKKYRQEITLIKGNSGQLHQVFLNIISNAIQAINQKGTIGIETSLTENKATVKISDSGCGIPTSDIKKVTDPFFTTKAPGEGTGLGLAISQKIINEQHGSLHIDSEIDKGTIVTILLPLA